MPVTSSAACSVAVLVIDPANIPSVWPICTPNAAPSPSATSKSGNDRDEGEQIVLSPSARQPLEELPPVQDADPVQEHDQSDQSDGTRDLRLRRKSSDCQADEQHGTDAEGEAKDADLPNRVAEANGEK